MQDFRITNGRALCLGHPELVDNDNDAEVASPDVQKMCRACPIMYTCLEIGLVCRMEFGIWGGTTAAQRKRIWYPDVARTMELATKAHCPVCSSTDIVADLDICVCLECATEWERI